MRWGGRPHWTCGICDETKLIPRPGGQSQQHGKLNPTHYATGGPTMPVGPVSGETANLLISSVAANTQAHETTAVHQPDPTSDWLWRRSLALFELFLKYFSKYLLPNLIRKPNVFLSWRGLALFRAIIMFDNLPAPWYCILPNPEIYFQKKKKGYGQLFFCVL